MKWLKRSEPIVPEPIGEIDEESLDLELAELKHRKRQQQQQLPPPDRTFHSPGPVDLDPHEVQEHAHTLDRRVIDLHAHEIEEDDPHLPRTLSHKIFGIGPSGYFQLAVLCIAVGAVFEAGGLNPFVPGFTFQTALNGLATGAMNVLGWALQTGWLPMVIGAAVVLPLWLVWRLLSVPFRH